VKYKELVEIAKSEIAEETKRKGIDAVKERLVEIREAEKVLSELRESLEKMLDIDVE
jgi:hypothetical protein